MDTSLIIGLLLIVGLFVLLCLGVPVAATMGILAVVGMALGPGLQMGLSVAGIETYNFLSSYALIPLPMFTLMASLFLIGRVGSDVFEMATKWLSRLRGGLAMVCVWACAVFAALSGSSIAATATMGAVVLPQMKERGYATRLSVGVIGAAGGLAHLIPPSAMAVLYSVLVGVSAGKQLFAGAIPGLIVAVGYALVVLVWVSVKRNAAPPESGVTWKERLITLRKVILPIIIVLAVLGSIYTGIATVTESAAIGAFMGLLICIFRRVGLKKMRDAVVEAVVTTGFIMLISAGAKAYSWVLGYYMIPQFMIGAITNLQMDPIWFIVAIQVLYFILGALIDPISMLLITVPVIYPALIEFGFDPIWFGVLALVNIETALVTPPFGFHLFVLKGIAPEVPMSDIIAGCMIFMVSPVLVIALLLAFPQIALWLPNMMLGGG